MSSGKWYPCCLGLNVLTHFVSKVITDQIMACHLFIGCPVVFLKSSFCYFGVTGQLKEKKGRWKFFKRWKTRYFTLSGATITFSKKDSVGVLNLQIMNFFDDIFFCVYIIFSKI